MTSSDGCGAPTGRASRVGVGYGVVGGRDAAGRWEQSEQVAQNRSGRPERLCPDHVFNRGVVRMRHVRSCLRPRGLPRNFGATWLSRHAARCGVVARDQESDVPRAAGIASVASRRLSIVTAIRNAGGRPPHVFFWTHGRSERLLPSWAQEKSPGIPGFTAGGPNCRPARWRIGDSNP